ncbi:GNAT family N-acetyltransferase [Pedobacter nototheniae]|uniref:GNAT family N-acetyltransferase n=1 Tax=Pedobacter nototheniae TaxID=2488994 RepID=UPI00103F2560|nr:GNAT family N-acetyltransferase [Pedobacter nototheniae]
MQKEFKIERLDNQFCEEIIGLILPIQQIEFKVDIDLSAQPDLLDIESNYDGTGGAFWGAKIDGELVGTIALIAIPEYKTGVIRKMFVKKDFRGKELGIAQKLFTTLIDYCHRNDFNEIYLGTKDVLQAACRFYERNGFVKIPMESLPVYFPRMEVDNVFYKLSLNTVQ